MLLSTRYDFRRSHAKSTRVSGSWTTSRIVTTRRDRATRWPRVSTLYFNECCLSIRRNTTSDEWNDGVSRTTRAVSRISRDGCNTCGGLRCLMGKTSALSIWLAWWRGLTLFCCGTDFVLHVNYGLGILIGKWGKPFHATSFCTKTSPTLKSRST